MKRGPSLRKLVRLTTSYGILIFVTLLIMLPIVWFILTSLKAETEYLSYPITVLPKVAEWRNYITIFDPSYHYLKYAWHSIALSLTFTLLTVAVSSMSGFAFSRFTQVRWRNRLFSIIVALLIVPSIVTLIPQFVLFSRLKLTNTYWPWVLWGLGGSAFHIFLFRQFFLSFPIELEEAAEVDGCGSFRIFLQIFLPNAKPALATSFIFLFNATWSDYIAPVMYLNDAKTTLAVKLSGSSNLFVNPHGWPIVPLTITGCVIYTLPLVIMFFFGQKAILRGTVTSGLKG
jgi:ABC-type glycerol-3-phosphate transport system permease component